jgi:hypothetical protein
VSNIQTHREALSRTGVFSKDYVSQLTVWL